MIFEKEHELVRQLARSFAENEIKPIAEDVDKTADFPMEVYKKMGKAGFLGVKTPVEYGGAGGDHRSYAIVMEEIAKASGVASIYISGNNSLYAAPLLKFGNEEQKKKFLPALCSGDIVLAFGLTEPGAGSDAASILTTAVKDGDDYILNGRKTFITAAPFSDYVIVFAKTNPAKGVKGITAFIVDSKAEGVSFGKPEDKMGMIGCATSDVVLEDVRVSPENILGEVDNGFVNAMKTLSLGRLGISAQALGIAEGALDRVIEYTKERKQFGRAIGAFQNTQFQIADMATKVEAAQLLVYKAAMAKATQKVYSVEAAKAKLYAAEVAMEVTTKAVQLHGGYGYTREYDVERMMRDAKITEIYEGTSEVQRMVISGALLK